MSALQPVAVYALRIPPGIGMVPAVPDFAAMFRITMAAIDPSEEITVEAVGHKGPPRATLKVIRVPDDLLDDEDSDDEDFADTLDDEDESDSDEEANGGPSDKQAKKMLEALAEDDDMDDDEDDEVDAAEIIKKLLKGKGKGKAVDGEDDDDDDDDDDDEDEDSDDLSDELEECVICTLDLEKHYQQPVDIVVSEGEKIFFQVTGTHTIHLTGNYVMPIDDGRASLYNDEDEEDEYDLSPDEDELDLEALEGEESDDLDDLEDPRVMDVDSEEEAAKPVKPVKSKGKNKRPADDSEDEKAVGLDEIMAKSLKEEAAVNGDSKKLSKAEKKAAKKLKKNDGEAAPVASATPESKKDTSTNGSEKKVQFSKDLVQGPTPSATPPTSKKDTKKDDKKTDAKPATSSGSSNGTSLGVRDLNGVTVDDRKLGNGPAAKKGSKLDLRYIGKLDNGKVFDSNKSGKPFSIKLGQGEVIKGWDVGLVGITAGGERRLTIPPALAYGNKALPGIPKNSKLIFDVKCLSVK